MEFTSHWFAHVKYQISILHANGQCAQCTVHMHTVHKICLQRNWFVLILHRTMCLLLNGIFSPLHLRSSDQIVELKVKKKQKKTHLNCIFREYIDVFALFAFAFIIELAAVRSSYVDSMWYNATTFYEIAMHEPRMWNIKIAS